MLWELVEKYVNENHPGVTNSGCILWWDEWWARLCGVLDRLEGTTPNDLLPGLPQCTAVNMEMEDMLHADTVDEQADDTSTGAGHGHLTAGLVDEFYMEAMANDELDMYDDDDDATPDADNPGQPTLLQLWRTSRLQQRWRRQRQQQQVRTSARATTSTANAAETSGRTTAAATVTAGSGGRPRGAHTTQDTRAHEPTTDDVVIPPADAEWAVDPGG